MKTKAPTTRAEHHVQHMRKQVIGFRIIIADLQKALRTFRERATSAEREAAIAWSACALLEHIARMAVAELPEDRREHWLAQFPCFEEKEEAA